MGLPKSVKIFEVGPRDGLQNEPAPVDTESKVALIEMLADAGVQAIESGSFVSPKWVPQMAGSEAVFGTLNRQPGVTYSALTPNMRGLERAISAKVSEVAVFIAASEAFSQKNTNCSIDEGLARAAELTQVARAEGLAVRGYISVVAGCPYQGEVKPSALAPLAKALLDMGCYEVSLGDSTGVATPGQINNIIDSVATAIPIEKIAIHLHNTYGQALANMYAALQMGVAVVDSSVAGLGGCPYAPGATGNVATEDVIYMLNGLGIRHGIDLGKLVQAGEFITQKLGRRNDSGAARALLAKGAVG
ncbi:MAG: hydroxymethylglutaryl-CoA lyase [Gammaproteobacteria bacterium]|nr:hydroxymethylglutaryl-CoA lyase [Gammaproteobacteria bacterium]MBQ0839926.1 hydroxymethylglutaryl-CoA lyase [Gammaproteobacteria bacterium]